MRVRPLLTAVHSPVPKILVAVIPSTSESPFSALYQSLNPARHLRENHDPPLYSCAIAEIQTSEPSPNGVRAVRGQIGTRLVKDMIPTFRYLGHGSRDNPNIHHIPRGSIVSVFVTPIYLFSYALIYPSTPLDKGMCHDPTAAEWKRCPRDEPDVLTYLPILSYLVLFWAESNQYR
ncbi:hypothetical protein CIB48_g9069 [Xylaria polymorpha]|nr:hypothetical protein CIB48_g9069 [Xylaria polymorpha]